MELFLLIKMITLILWSQPDPPINTAITKHPSPYTCQVLAKKGNFCVNYWEYKESK